MLVSVLCCTDQQCIFIEINTFELSWVELSWVELSKPRLIQVMPCVIPKQRRHMASLGRLRQISVCEVCMQKLWDGIHKVPYETKYYIWRQLNDKCILYGVNSSDQVPHICVANVGNQWFSQCLVTCSGPRPYLSQRWLFFNHTPRNELQCKK